MAAVSDAQAPQLVDLRSLRVEDLNPILAEETRVWREKLAWDYQPSGDLVRRFVQMQALNGYALWHGGRAIGYSYYVCEDQKGLIGDLYVLEEFATIVNENRLLDAVLGNLIETPFVRRIESQLMMLRGVPGRQMPQASFLQIHERNFMSAHLARVNDLAPGPASRRLIFEKWTERRQDEVAHLIAEAYQGHVDSQINDQYRSVAGARRFLLNIVQYPGCGSFFQPASYLALERGTGQLCGVSLSSLVAKDVGHVTQICVSPSVRGTGAGYELMRHSMLSLAANGCRDASLTVTAVNSSAVRLYEQMGFSTRRRFCAYVWDGF